MNSQTFSTGLGLLADAFDKRVSDSLRAVMWAQLQDYRDMDFAHAVQALIDEPDRRGWPRIGEIKAAIGRAAEARHDREWAETKRREAREVAELMHAPHKAGARAENRAFLRRLIETIPDGAEAIKALVREIDPDPDTPPPNSRGCMCSEDGLLWYEQAEPSGERYGYVAACQRCNCAPRSYPRIDPASLVA